MRTYVEPHLREGNPVAGYWREVADHVEHWAPDMGGRPSFSGSWFGGKNEFVFSADEPQFRNHEVEWRAIWYPEHEKGFYWFESRFGPFHGEVHTRLVAEGAVPPRSRQLRLSGTGREWDEDAFDFYRDLRSAAQEHFKGEGTPEQYEQRKAHIIDSIRRLVRRMKNDRDTVEILHHQKSATYVKPYQRGGNLVQGYWRELHPGSEEWRGPLFKGTFFGWDNDFIYADNEPFFDNDGKLFWKALYYPDTDTMKFWVPSAFGPHHDTVLERAWRDHAYGVADEGSYKIAGTGNEWQIDPQYEDEFVLNDFADRYAHDRLEEERRFMDDPDEADIEEMLDHLREEGRNELKRRVASHLRSFRREMDDMAILTGNKTAKEIMEFVVPLEDAFQETEHPRDPNGRFTDKPWMYALPPPTLRDFDGDRDAWDIGLRAWLDDTFPPQKHISPRTGEETVWDNRFDVEGIDPSLLYDMSQSLYRFAKEYPFVIDGSGVNFEGDKNDVGRFEVSPGGERRPAFAGVRLTDFDKDKEMVFASYEIDGDGELNLNTDWWAERGKRRERLEETLGATEATGWFARGTGTPGGVINHELGHALTAYIGANHPDLWQWLEDERWFGSVSKYARQNFLEFFAETFSSLQAEDRQEWDYEQRMLASVLGELQSRESGKM